MKRKLNMSASPEILSSAEPFNIAQHIALVQRKRLWIAVAISLVVHLLLIGGVRFTLPSLNTLKNRATIDVVLINSRSAHAPNTPDVQAQYNLDGGGNTNEANRRIKTPLPAQNVADPNQNLQLATRKVQEAEARVKNLLSKLNQLPKLPDDTVQPKKREQLAKSLDVNEMRRQASEIARQEGEIARELQAYQSRPHKAFVGARAKSVVEAQYVDSWRAKIERIGTLNYPVDGTGQRMVGKLLVTVEIYKDGSLKSVEINRSSGNTALDNAALRIVRQAAPFAVLPRGIVDGAGNPADILAITRSWTFTRNDTVLTTN